MGIRVSRQTAALIAMVLIAFGLLVFSAPARPRAAAAAPHSIVASAAVIASEDLATMACRDFLGCAEGRRVTYCETSLPHKRWPSMNTAMLDFIQGGKAKPP